jgi:hypothetical protein
LQKSQSIVQGVTSDQVSGSTMLNRPLLIWTRAFELMNRRSASRGCHANKARISYKAESNSFQCNIISWEEFTYQVYFCNEPPSVLDHRVDMQILRHNDLLFHTITISRLPTVLAMNSEPQLQMTLVGHG